MALTISCRIYTTPVDSTLIGISDRMKSELAIECDRNQRGIFPNEGGITRLLGAVLAEQNEDWLLQHRNMPQQSMLEIDQNADAIMTVVAN